MQLFAVLAMVVAFMLALFALTFFVKAERASYISVKDRFGVTCFLVCVAAVIAYGSLSVLVGGAP